MVVSLGQEMNEVNGAQLAQLKQAAMSSPQKRARICLHRDHYEKVQEMVIAFCRDSYVRPHRHAGKSESFHMIEGELLLVLFSECGQVTRRTRLSPGECDGTFLCRLPGDVWHSVIPLSTFVIVHETTTGPFLKDTTEHALWCPDGSNAEEIAEFQAYMMR
ncbi:MAG: hypothetical protein NPIRA02_03080 [Nitrospirales bacterium]|nr:MAG: hypothetical protein NPIRA02_03080 [Nitrospirales bacterium]